MTWDALNDLGNYFLMLGMAVGPPIRTDFASFICPVVGVLRGSGDVVLVVADMVLVETDVGHVEAVNDLLIVLDFREFDRISVSSSGFLLFCGSGRVRVR